MTTEPEGNRYLVLPPAQILYGALLFAFILFGWVPAIFSTSWVDAPSVPRIAFAIGVPACLFLVGVATIAGARVLRVKGSGVSQRWMNLVELGRYDLAEVAKVESIQRRSPIARNPTLKVKFEDGDALVIYGSCWNYKRFSEDLAKYAGPYTGRGRMRKGGARHEV